MAKRIGKYTVEFENDTGIMAAAGVAGKKESEGPLGEEFDKVFTDTKMNSDSWEQAESSLQKEALNMALQKASLQPDDVDYVFAGDLLNQCIGSTFGLMTLELPFVGMYGACSTMALTLSMASVFVEAGIAGRASAVTSSHYCSSERQFRFPLEYGGQRPPSAQWTVTGAGAAIVTKGGEIKINHITTGRIVDLGVTDQNNMGGAMAPAAADTLMRFLKDTGTSPTDYDLILTGDLGRVGSELLYQLLEREKIDIRENHKDCGAMIFYEDQPEVFAGGSGCGCSASVFCSHIINRMKKGELKNILFMATGALMSPTSCMQGENIPGIAHLVHLSV